MITVGFNARDDAWTRVDVSVSIVRILTTLTSSNRNPELVTTGGLVKLAALLGSRLI
jgi:hypothetical protein